MRNVSVSLNADNQIEVHVGSESRAGESYYLGLQPSSENHEFRPIEGTMQLVREWIRLLTEMPQRFFSAPAEFPERVNLHRKRRGMN